MKCVCFCPVSSFQNLLCRQANFTYFGCSYTSDRMGIIFFPIYEFQPPSYCAWHYWSAYFVMRSFILCTYMLIKTYINATCVGVPRFRWFGVKCSSEPVLDQWILAHFEAINGKVVGWPNRKMYIFNVAYSGFPLSKSTILSTMTWIGSTCSLSHQAPVPLAVFQSNSNFDQNLQCFV